MQPVECTQYGQLIMHSHMQRRDNAFCYLLGLWHEVGTGFSSGNLHTLVDGMNSCAFPD